jgi:hypothetical protein
MKNFVIFSTRKIQQKASNDCQDRINVSRRESSDTAKEGQDARESFSAFSF